MRDLKVRQVNPRALNAARYNPRRIIPRELEKLRRSIREYGFVEPVLVRRADKTIIGGQQRVKAAILEGKKSIPAIFLDITKDRAKALNLALNRRRRGGHRGNECASPQRLIGIPQRTQTTSGGGI